jgi:hypothetical protein
MNLIDGLDEMISCPPAACRRCGANPAGVPVTAQRRHQVTDIESTPTSKTTGYVAQAKECAGYGTVTSGDPPAHVRGRCRFRSPRQSGGLALTGSPLADAFLARGATPSATVSTARSRRGRTHCHRGSAGAPLARDRIAGTRRRGAMIS